MDYGGLWIPKLDILFEAYVVYILLSISDDNYNKVIGFRVEHRSQIKSNR